LRTYDLGAALANGAEMWNALQAEFRRLGLRIEDIPGLAVSGEDAAERLLAHTRSLEPGASWHDVLPDLPAHWVPGRPETWTTPYRPLGPYDYQEPPTGAGLHLVWEGGADQLRLDAFLVAARAAGWPVYGAGLIEVSGKDGKHLDALIVLTRGTTDDQRYEFWDWVDAQPGIRVAACFRTGEETYR
jgi:hypothetical protein